MHKHIQNYLAVLLCEITDALRTNIRETLYNRLMNESTQMLSTARVEDADLLSPANRYLIMSIELYKNRIAIVIPSFSLELFENESSITF